MRFLDQKHLERAILETIVYFDLFDYPLTTLEVWSNLRIKADYGEVYNVLYSSDHLISKNGFWHLKLPLRDGAPSLSGERARRYRASKYKLNKARRFARFLKWVPWIQAVYVCNSLGFLASRPESDIDFFIIARAGRIWSARFFTILLAKLFGQRPAINRRKDTFCFSFYAVEGADMKKAALPGDDIYYDFWLKNLLLIWKRPGLERVRNNRVGEVAERLLKKFQIWIMPRHLKDMANKGTAVIINDEFLKFHDHDRRADIKKQFQARLAEVIA